MKTGMVMGTTLGALVLIGGGLFLWLRPAASVAIAPMPHRQTHDVPAHHPHQQAPGSAPVSPQTAPSSVVIGTVPWLKTMRADLSQHLPGTTVPPLWAAPWPNHPYGWVLLDPLAQHGQLWYGAVTKAQPAAPEWWSIPTNLKEVTTAQLDALPWPLRQALSLVYDLQNGLPYPVSTSGDALSVAGPGQANWDAMAGNPPGDPAGWSLQWQPAEYGYPETLTVNVIVPWTVHHPTAGQPATVWLAIQAGLTSHTRIRVAPVGYVLPEATLAQAAEPATPAQGLVSVATP